MERLLESLFSWLESLFSPKPSAGRTIVAVQPYIKNSRNKGLINYWWSTVFYNNDNLRRLANGYSLYPRQGYGLIYYYIVGGQLRYVGQTRERSLKWRMTRRQPNGHTGYNYSIKRQMLNAFRSSILEIQTKEVGVSDLDATEEHEIKFYSRTNRLWNIEHNFNYRQSNRWS